MCMIHFKVRSSTKYLCLYNYTQMEQNKQKKPENRQISTLLNLKHTINIQNLTKNLVFSTKSAIFAVEIQDNMNTKRILVIAPHADDEVLGCGGYLLHQHHALKKVVVGTIGGMDVRQDFKKRKEEFELVCHKLEASGSWLFQDMDAMLDTIPCLELITSLDYEIDRFRPDEIFINYRSRHQDHVKMYDCAMASLRLREGYRPKFVALYEYPFITNGTDSVDGGKAYHDITDVISEKVNLFNLYKSQVRKAPSPLNEEGIRSLAHIRGLECGCKYAEKFYVQKMMMA